MEIFPDFSSFVTVFHGLLGPVVRLAKRMFCITNGFADDFERFCHGSNLCFSVRLMPTMHSKRSLAPIAGSIGIRRFKLLDDTTRSAKSHSIIFPRGIRTIQQTAADERPIERKLVPRHMTFSSVLVFVGGGTLELPHVPK